MGGDFLAMPLDPEGPPPAVKTLQPPRPPLTYISVLRPRRCSRGGTFRKSSDKNVLERAGGVFTFFVPVSDPIGRRGLVSAELDS